MKRVFGNQRDFDLYTAVAQQSAILDREAYSFIEDEIFWPQFKRTSNSDSITITTILGSG